MCNKINGYLFPFTNEASILRKYNHPNEPNPGSFLHGVEMLHTRMSSLPFPRSTKPFILYVFCGYSLSLGPDARFKDGGAYVDQQTADSEARASCIPWLIQGLQS